MTAVSEWKISASDFPLNAQPREKLEFAVKYSLLTSSAIRWPTWDCQVSDGFAELIAKDAQAGTPEADERETLIGCGLSLQFLKLTLKHLGCLGRMELFPDLNRQTLVARIHTGSSGVRSASDERLYRAMQQSDPAVRKEPTLPDSAMMILSHAADGEHGWMEFARSDASRGRLWKLMVQQQVTVEGWKLRDEAPASSLLSNGNSRRSGAASLLQSFSRWRKPHLAVRVRADEYAPDETAQPGTLAVVKTKTDDKHGWVGTGQVLARLVLQSRAMGIACTPFVETLRSARLRSELRTEIGRKGFVQAILRFDMESSAAFSASALVTTRSHEEFSSHR